MQRLILILFCCLVLGCGGSPSAENTPASQPTNEETTTAPPTSEPVAESSTPTEEPTIESTQPPTETLADVAVANDFTELDSYQFTAEYVIVDADSAENLQRIDVRWEYAGDEQRFDLVTRGVDPQSVTMVVQGEQSYMLLEGLGCAAMPTANARTEQFADVVNTEQFVERLGEAERVYPNEMINGVETAHYQFDGASLALQSNADGVTATGDLYLDAVTNRLVRLVINGTDPAAFGMTDAQFSADDTFSIIYNVSEVDVPRTIVLPEGCGDSADVDYPQLPDAYDITTANNMLFYYTAETPERIIDFYQEALAEEGWLFNEADSSLGAQTSILNFERDDEALSVIVSTVTTQDASTVTVIRE